MKNIKLLLVAVAVLVSTSSFAQDKKAKHEMKPEKVMKNGAVTSEALELEEVVVKAEFPGGNQEMFKFLGKNLKYPKYEKKKNIEGVVYAEFVIKKDGTVDDVTILKSVEKSKKLDKEVKRVLAMMPKWKPAMKDGNPIDSKMTLPVRFAL